MRENVFWRKQATIIMMLAKQLKMSPEKALDLFYSTNECKLLSNPKTGLYLMSNQYIIDDILTELQHT